MLRFYLCPWWLLAIVEIIVEIICGWYGTLYVTSYMQKIFSSSRGQYDLELEGAIQIKSKLLPDSLYPHIYPETGGSKLFLNTFGKWTLILSHSPFHYWSVLTTRKFLNLLSWNLPSGTSTPWFWFCLLDGVIAPLSSPPPHHDLSYSTLNKFTFVSVLLECKCNTPGPAWQSEAGGTQPLWCWAFCSHSRRWN